MSIAWSDNAPIYRQLKERVVGMREFIDGLALPEAAKQRLRALGLVKAAAAEANASLGLLPPAMADAIAAAAREVADGRHDAHFPIDVFQTGSGTSSNMPTTRSFSCR